jgi:hypothetical protein
MRSWKLFQQVFFVLVGFFIVLNVFVDRDQKEAIQRIDGNLDRLAHGWMDNRAGLAILAAEQSGLLEFAEPYVIQPPEVLRDDPAGGDDFLLTPLESLERYYPKTWAGEWDDKIGIAIEPGEGIKFQIEIPLEEDVIHKPEIEWQKLTPEEVDQIQRESAPVPTDLYDQTQMF